MLPIKMIGKQTRFVEVGLFRPLDLSISNLGRFVPGLLSAAFLLKKSVPQGTKTPESESVKDVLDTMQQNSLTPYVRV